MEAGLLQLGSARPRRVVILAVILGYAPAIYASSLADWFEFAVFSILLTALLLSALWRLRLEYRIAQNPLFAVGTVLVRKVGPGAKRGVRIQYGFLDSLSRMFIGSVGGTVLLPSEGTPIAIAYNASNAEINLPVKSFWFYEFETGQGHKALANRPGSM
jgi:hypothetical protein